MKGKTGAIIAARMGSRRLPGKVMMDLGGKPMLQWVIEAVERSDVDETVVLVTPDPRDAEIQSLCKKLNIQCAVGSADRDLLGDFVMVASKYGFSHIVRVTADCPLIDTSVINSIIQGYSDKYDYCTNALDAEHRTFPRGLDVEVVSYKTLKWLNENLDFLVDDQTDYRKHVTLYIREHYKEFAVRSISIDISRVRMVVDTEDEYNKTKKLFEYMGGTPNWLGALEIMVYKDNNNTIMLDTDGSQTKALGKTW